MPIVFNCPYCNKKFRAQDRFTGRRIKCSKCNEHIIIPQQEIATSHETLDVSADAPAAKELSNISKRISPKKKYPNPAQDYFRTVTQILEKYSSCQSIYLAGNIPDKKEINARKHCNLNQSEPLLALIDCTVFGSAKDCVLFTTVALYSHWQIAATNKIPYEEFPSRNFFAVGHWEIKIDANRTLNLSGSSFPRDSLIDILNEIKQSAQGNAPKPTPVISIPTPDKYPAIVEEIIREYALKGNIYLQGTIPPQKEYNARAVCNLSQSEPIIALLDCTVFGSAKHCFMFTSDAIYCSKAKLRNGTGLLRVPYNTLLNRKITSGDGGWINFGQNESVDVIGWSGQKNDLIALLWKIQTKFAGGVSPVHGKKCPQCQSELVFSRRIKKSGWTGPIVGGMLFGIAGAMIGGALSPEREYVQNECKDCGFAWQTNY